MFFHILVAYIFVNDYKTINNNNIMIDLTKTVEPTVLPKKDSMKEKLPLLLGKMIYNNISDTKAIDYLGEVANGALDNEEKADVIDTLHHCAANNMLASYSSGATLDELAEFLDGYTKAIIKLTNKLNK